MFFEKYYQLRMSCITVTVIDVLYILILQLFPVVDIQCYCGSRLFYILLRPVHVLLSRFYPDFIQILSRFYPDFIQILSRFFKNSFYSTLSRFYPNFKRGLLDSVSILQGGFQAIFSTFLNSVKKNQEVLGFFF